MTEGTGGADERLVVMLEARIADFERRMKQAERTGTQAYDRIKRASGDMSRKMEMDGMAGVRGLNMALASVTTRIGGLAAAFAGGLFAGGLAGLSSQVRVVIGDIGDLNDAATRLGLSTDDLQGLEHGFQLQGLAADEARGALEKFVDGIGQAAQGSGTLLATLEANGIALRDQNGALRSTGDLLRDYANLMNSAPDAAAKMALATDGFGRGGREMVNALQGGGAAIDDMIRAAKEGGYVLDAALVQKAAELDDKFDKLAGRIKVLFQTAAVYSADAMDQTLTSWREKFYAAMAEFAATGIRPTIADFAIDAIAVELDTSAAELALSTLRLEAGMVVIDLGAAAAELDRIGNTTAAAKLRDLIGEVQQLGAELHSDKITVDDYGLAMGSLETQIGETIAELAQVDEVGFGNVIDRLAGLAGAVKAVLGLAKDLRQEANAPAPGPVASLSGPAGGPPVKAQGMAGSPRPHIRPWYEEGDDAVGGVGAGGGGGGGGGRSNSAAIDALIRDLQTERELLDGWYAESQGLLSAATDLQLEALGGRHDALERLEMEHQERMTGIAGEGQGKTLADAESFFGSLATITQAGGDKAAKAYRVFAAAEALINTYRAQAQVLADPRLGFFAKFGAVAAIGAAGIGLVSALGGGGGSSSASARPGTGAGDSGSTGGASQGSILTLTLQGLKPSEIYQGQTLIDMVDAMQKELGNRGLKIEVVR